MEMHHDWRIIVLYNNSRVKDLASKRLVHNWQ